MLGNVSDRVGYPIINSGKVPGTTQEIALGTIVHGQDPFWGPGEFMYCKTSAAIGQFGLCMILSTFNSTTGVWDFTATPVPNTANLGHPLGVSTVKATAADQFVWVRILGVTPINCTASVSADAAFGITAAGQAGARAAGKQVLNAHMVASASTTVAKAATQLASGTKQITVPSGANGWFIGAYLSGTGVATGATVASISDDGTIVTMSAASTAQINGTVTATYNNGTVYYNVAMLNRPFAQGAIS